MKQEIPSQTPAFLGNTRVICLYAFNDHAELDVFDTEDPEGRTVTVKVGESFKVGDTMWKYVSHDDSYKPNLVYADDQGIPFPGVNGSTVTFETVDDSG